MESSLDVLNRMADEADERRERRAAYRALASIADSLKKGVHPPASLAPALEVPVPPPSANISGDNVTYTGDGTSPRKPVQFKDLLGLLFNELLDWRMKMKGNTTQVTVDDLLNGIAKAQGFKNWIDAYNSSLDIVRRG